MTIQSKKTAMKGRTSSKHLETILIKKLIRSLIRKKNRTLATDQTSITELAKAKPASSMEFISDSS